MRTFKFRAYDTKYKAWINIDSFYLSMFNVSRNFELLLRDAPEEEFSLEEKYIELMQWIGIQDKNGVDIYEGDVIHSENYDPPLMARLVEYRLFEHFGCCGLVSGSGFELGVFSENCIVIGNKYDNPELVP